MKGRLVPIVVLFFVIVLGLSYLFPYLLTLKMQHFIDPKLKVSLKMKAFRKIRSEWSDRAYDDSGRVSCDADHLLKKSRENKLFFSLQRRIYQISIDNYRWGKPADHVIFKINIRDKKKKSYIFKRDFEIVLEDHCNMFILPQKEYKSLGLLEWDNKNRMIAVDSNLVTFKKIKAWKKESNISLPKIESILKKDGQELAGPAFGLTKSEMENYCKFKGKKILSSYIYDASTFHPGKLKYPYPWTTHSLHSFLSMAQEYGSDLNLNGELCKKAFVKGCRSFLPYRDYQLNSQSWTGFNEVLGGVMEYIENRIDESGNLILSSEIFPASHEAHSLLVRGHWDGKNFNDKSIILSEKYRKTREDITLFLNKEKNNQLKIGFRCLKIMEGQKND